MWSVVGRDGGLWENGFIYNRVSPETYYWPLKDSLSLKNNREMEEIDFGFPW